MEKIDLGKRYYYEDLYQVCKNLKKQYPDFIQQEEIGRSHDGRGIVLMKAGRGQKNILLTAGVHGRETINPSVLLALLQIYCENNRDFLEEYTLYVVPLLNPDGYMVALRGFHGIKSERLRLTVKSKGIPWYLWKYNARGVDLNRNFPSQTWEKKNHGDIPASELETKALIGLFHEREYIGYLDYHSRGKTIYYYRKTMPKDYNKTQYQLACGLCRITDYMLAPKQEEIDTGDSGGNTVHYFSEVLKKPALTIETVDDYQTFPLEIQLQKETLREILDTPRVFENR